MLLERGEDERRLRDALARAPVVVLTGPRQAGKSTLAQEVVRPDGAHLFDLEDPIDRARLAEPSLALRDLDGTVVIDEAQLAPTLFPELRVLVDADRRPGRFLVLGSASPDLVGLSAESLAGRVTLLELPGLRLTDVGPDAIQRLWLRGGLPPTTLAVDDRASSLWRADYVETFLRRDLADLGIRLPAATVRRFWSMLAHYHGQTWNGAEIAQSIDVSQPTARRYLDALTDALVVRQLHPWFANIAKRQVKAPKVYVRDSGLMHSLLGITDAVTLGGHPKVGASWEGFVIEQLLGRDELNDPWFWATHNGAEIDLIVRSGTERIGVEVKHTERPSATPSMRNALVDLQLDRIVVVHRGIHRFPLTERIEAIGAADAITLGLAPTIRT